MSGKPFHVMTVVNAPSAFGGAGCHRSRTTGWRVGNQCTLAVGIEQFGRCTFSPYVASVVYLENGPPSPNARVCVNTGSVSTSTRSRHSPTSSIQLELPKLN